MIAFHRRLEIVSAQSAALGAALAVADPSDPVPSCPDWTVRDLVEHHGNVLRGWAAVVDAADPAGPPGWMADDGPRPWQGPTDDLAGWYVASRRALVDALARAGEDGPAWTWWGEPATAGAIARHQVQEACVHRWDAQTAAGLTADPIPDDAAVDGVEEFLTVGLVAEPPPWDGPPVRVGLLAEGASPWLLVADGTVRAVPCPPGPGKADAVVEASASDAVLLLYARIPATSLPVEGDRDAATRLFS